MASLISALVTTGCENDTERADRTAAERTAKVQSSVDPKERAAAINTLKQASDTPNLSGPAKVDAKMRVAREEIAGGDALVQLVEANEIEANRLIGQIQGMAAQVYSNNATMAGYQKLEPKAALEDVEKQKAAAKGSGDDAVWIKSEAGGVPSQSAVDAQIARLTAEGDKLKAERAQLETQQRQATADAVTLEEQVRKEKGKAALDHATQSATLRKQARDAATRIETIDAGLARVGQDLKVAQAQQSAAANALKAFDARSQQIDESWKQVSETIQTHGEQSKRLLAGGEASPAPATAPAGKAGAALRRDNSISALAQQLKTLLARIDSDRVKAIDLYQSAEQHINDASKAASQFVSTLNAKTRDPSYKGSPEAAAWSQLTDLLNPSDFELEQAGIQTRLARVYATQAIGTALRGQTRDDLEKTLSAAKLELPKELADLPPTSSAADLRKKADDAFTASETLLNKVAEAPGGRGQAALAQKAAQTARILEAYSRAQYQARTGNATGAKTNMDFAVARVSELKTNPDALPGYLPPDLAAAAGIVLVAPTPLMPTTGPATMPSMTPSMTPATAPSGSPFPQFRIPFLPGSRGAQTRPG
jgi:hypothetical protein